MKNSILLIVTISLFFIDSQAFCQKIVKTSGSTQVRMEANMTLKDVYEKAEELAIIDAIQNAFGTSVEQQTDMFIIDSIVCHQSSLNWYNLLMKHVIGH